MSIASSCAYADTIDEHRSNAISCGRLAAFPVLPSLAPLFPRRVDRFNILSADDDVPI
jgi:hypothetical protein